MPGKYKDVAEAKLPPSGANVAAALQLLHGEARGQTVVTLACDSGLKYLSTDL